MKTPTEPGLATPRRVLIVGASSSIGEDIVARFAGVGDRVLATVRGQPADPALRNGVSLLVLDLAVAASFDRVVSAAVDVGGLDVVVFLSGILPGKALADYDDALMHEVMTVNFTGQAALLRRLQPQLREGARVIFVSSVSAERGSFDPVYAASKAAQIAFVKSLATWLAPAVRVNAIAPALIDGSSMFDAMAPERRQHHVAQTPTKRLTTKGELADIVFDLCSPAWANLNGQVIRLNGGAHV